MRERQKGDDLIIRDASASDASEIAKMAHDLAEFEQKDISSFPFNEETLLKHAFSKDPYFWLVVAEEQECLIGYGLYYYTYRPSEGAPILYMEDLYVKAASRRRGIGTSLIAYLAQKAKQKDCAYMDWKVFSWNEKAISFYTNCLKADSRSDLVSIRLRQAK